LGAPDCSATIAAAVATASMIAASARMRARRRPRGDRRRAGVVESMRGGVRPRRAGSDEARRAAADQRRHRLPARLNAGATRPPSGEDPRLVLARALRRRRAAWEQALTRLLGGLEGRAAGFGRADRPYRPRLNLDLSPASAVEA